MDGTHKGILKYLEERVPHCHFVDHKSRRDWPEINSGFSVKQSVTSYPNSGTAHIILLLIISVSLPWSSMSIFCQCLL
jgi:hypothetical protein